MIDPHTLRLYLVTDAPEIYPHDLLSAVEAALAGGASFLQYRAETGSRRLLYETAVSLSKFAQSYGVPFVINNHLDLALAIDGAGLHLGQDDLPAAVARRLLGSDRILGLSINQRADLEDPALAHVDYLGVGPVFPTQSKKDATPALGLQGLTAIVAATSLPTVAIGGIHLGNVSDVLGCGVDGVAVISALSRVENPSAAARALKTAKN